MRTVELDGVSYNLPERWEDVPRAQLPALIRLVYVQPERGATYHGIIRTALGISEKAWLKLHRKHFRPTLPHAVRRQNAEVLHQLVVWLSWLWKNPMNRQPFPKLVVMGQDWQLPDEDFATLTYGELTDLYIHLQAYIQQTKEADEALDYVVAIACRRQRPFRETQQPDWNGDAREPYNEFQARQRLPYLKHTPFEQKLSVLLYVASTIKTLMGRYRLFEGGTGGGNAEAYPGQDFIKNAHLMAEKGIFGNLRQTQQANAHEVLLFLEEHRADVLAQRQAQRNE